MKLVSHDINPLDKTSFPVLVELSVTFGELVLVFNNSPNGHNQVGNETNLTLSQQNHSVAFVLELEALAIVKQSTSTKNGGQ